MNDLDQLKELLFGAEKQALDSITRRVEKREVRTADVADILPEAIYQSHRKDTELVDALSEPVGECLQRALHDDPETYGDALYPVMGPAIRKSIMHALRNFAQQINEAVEHSISPKGLKWRLEASRAGIPFGEYLLQKSLRYRVEQAYLISRENGLLIGHVHHEASKIKDSDAVSAMFTAIQDFVKESFSPDRSGRLESADMGEFTLWAIHGPHALLVCVIRGVPPKALRADLSAILERIHFRYGDALREYRGDTSSLPGLDVDLERSLSFEARREAEGGKRSTAVWIAVLVLVVIALSWLGYRSWDLGRQALRLEAALEASPGLYLADIVRDGDVFMVRGLRDPLAPEIPGILTEANIDAGRVIFDFRPFQSLHPEIVAERAARLLGPPSTVEMTVADSMLVVSGDAPWSWRRKLRERHGELAGITSLDDSALSTPDRERYLTRIDSMNNRLFRFESGTEFSPGAAQELQDYAGELQSLQAEAVSFGFAVAVTLYGSTDETGRPELNAALAARRAETVAEVLRTHDVRVENVQRQTTGEGRELAPDDVRRRFVRIELNARPLQQDR